MDVAYVFAHPDDESFAPCLVMAQQLAAGHRVHLLTLTRGGASRMRLELAVTRRELEAIRTRELRAASRAIGVTNLSIADFPDGALADCVPDHLVQLILHQLRHWRPRLVVTLPPHGLNGHPDHCVTSAVTTAAFCRWRDAAPERVRLAHLGIPADEVRRWRGPVYGLAAEQVDVRVRIGAAEREVARQALACHASQATVIAEHDPLRCVGDELWFTLFAEHPRPVLSDLTAGL